MATEIIKSQKWTRIELDEFNAVEFTEMSSFQEIRLKDPEAGIYFWVFDNSSIAENPKVSAYLITDGGQSTMDINTIPELFKYLERISDDVKWLEHAELKELLWDKLQKLEQPELPQLAFPNNPGDSDMLEAMFALHSQVNPGSQGEIELEMKKLIEKNSGDLNLGAFPLHLHHLVNK